MTSTNGMLVLGLVLALVPASLWPRVSVADTAKQLLHIETSLGFSETVQLGRWAPLTVIVENTGRLVKGSLEVEVRAGDELAGTAFSTIYRRDLELTQGGRKRHSFTLFIDTISEPIVVRVMSEGQVAATHSIDLRGKFTDARLLVSLSRNASLDYLNENSADSTRVTYPHPGTLPSQWQGYDGVSAMVVQSVTFEQWTPQQFDALKKWLSQGGRLFVSGGPDYASLRTSRLAELLPARPVGLLTIDDPTGFHSVLGESFVAARPFSLHRIENRDGTVLLSAAGHPLVIERYVGLGRVTYLTFDIGAYPFAGWPGIAQFWRQQLKDAQGVPAMQLPKQESSVIPTLFRHYSHSFPPRLVVLSFMVAYLFVVVITCKFSDSSNRESTGTGQRKVWMASKFNPLHAPLLFIPLAYLLFVTLLSPARVYAKVVSIIDLQQQSTYARISYDLGLYSNRTDLAKLTLARSSVVYLPGVDRDRPDQVSTWVHSAGTTERLQVIEQQPFVLHTLKGNDVIPFDLQMSVQETAAGLELQINNQSDLAMAFTWLVFDGWLYPVAAFDAGAKDRFTLAKEHVVAVSDRKGISSNLGGIPERQQDALLTAIIHTVAQSRRELPLSSNEALLIGIASSKQMLVEPDAQLQSTQINLLKARLAVTRLTGEGMESGSLGSDAR